jgi:CheY-like chemotaxis protein
MSSTLNICRDKGFNGFIAKPIRPDKLIKQIVRILSGDAVWESPS